MIVKAQKSKSVRVAAVFCDAEMGLVHTASGALRATISDTEKPQQVTNGFKIVTSPTNEQTSDVEPAPAVLTTEIKHEQQTNTLRLISAYGALVLFGTLVLTSLYVVSTTHIDSCQIYVCRGLGMGATATFCFRFWSRATFGGEGKPNIYSKNEQHGRVL